MRLLTYPAAAFDALTPSTKAAVIMAVCGVFGVLSGFVLYIVFTHLLEQGGVAAKLTGVAIGLVVSMAIAWFADRLWEAIDNGHVSLGQGTRRTLIAALSLVIVFELSASAFEDLGRAVVGDYDGIRRVAADIAGRDRADGGDAIDAGQGAALFAMMRDELKAMENPCPECVKSPTMRLVALLPDAARYRIFFTELKLTDQQIREALIEPANKALLSSSFESCGTAGQRLPGSAAARTVWGTFDALSPGHDALQITTCRAELAATADDTRIERLTPALNALLARHDLYDADSFRLTVEHKPLDLSPATRATLAAQREQCDAIKASFGAGRLLGCLATAKSGFAKAGAGKLIPVAEIKALNRELLSAAFGAELVAPLPVYWWDLILLFLIWSTAAVVLGTYLAFCVFDDGLPLEGLKGVPMRAWVAVCAIAFSAVLAALLLTLARVLPFLWQLMFDPQAVDAPYPLFAVIPWFVQWLAKGGIGFAIPGWITLPLAIGTAFVVWANGQGKQDDSASTFAGFALLGMLLTSVVPVLGGVIGVLLVVAGAWIVPAFGLAFMLPHLKPGANLPQWWGAIALGGGLAIAAWVAALVTDVDVVYRSAIAIGGLLAAATGLLILRKVPVDDLWPLLAVTVGLTLLGGSAAVQQLTFAGALKELHPVTATPYARPEPTQLEIWQYLYRLHPQLAAEEIPEAFRAPPAADSLSEALHLELALTGSIGFWLTIGMLVAWSLKIGPRHAKEQEPAP